MCSTHACTVTHAVYMHIHTHLQYTYIHKYALTASTLRHIHVLLHIMYIRTLMSCLPLWGYILLNIVVFPKNGTTQNVLSQSTQKLSTLRSLDLGEKQIMRLLVHAYF